MDNSQIFQCKTLKMTCNICQVSISAEAKFCQNCGNTLNLAQGHQMTDAQYQEAQEKLNKNTKQNPFKQQSLDRQGSSQQITIIQTKIKKIQEKINQHRGYQSNVQDKCWYFGLNFQFDYGKIWSSISYWRSLIISNKNNCTQDMQFRTSSNCCQNCKQAINELNKLKSQWEIKIKQQFDFL